ncbi:peptidase S8/S53 domain-containing protein [Lactarius akahatsu]|uniref:Peptidase S8/S53 domain-containing protein n=1 Tax=Lactarius akahatsu TaxID=416441 RepID=A0AAD4LI49_9AGAM|nr:peptidase S8/S53 domain-containing protein [Lactarius akahatsu]
MAAPNLRRLALGPANRRIDTCLWSTKKGVILKTEEVPISSRCQRRGGGGTAETRTGLSGNELRIVPSRGFDRQSKVAAHAIPGLPMVTPWAHHGPTMGPEAPIRPPRHCAPSLNTNADHDGGFFTEKRQACRTCRCYEYAVPNWCLYSIAPLETMDSVPRRISSAFELSVVMVNALAALPFFLLFALASSRFKRDMRLHERRDGIPEGFTSKGPASPHCACPERPRGSPNQAHGHRHAKQPAVRPMDVQGGGAPILTTDLDVQYTIGLASGVQTVFISVGDQYQDGDLEGFLDIINFLSGKSAPPQVLTTSYGQDENTISRALCNAYASLSTRGVGILFSSGDGGVSGSQSQSCTTFVPTFPSGCPFVTSVGGTQNFNPETSAPFSSGGFSNYFDTPWYQTTAKAAYLSRLGSTYAGRFNASGRGFPDVSAAGTNLEIVLSGSVMSVDGTSCSSPIFASVVSLLNDRLIAAGKPVLGFLNLFLYSTGASALNDITIGSNPGCNTNGFPATVGWDPVTGLGTPNWAKLLAAVGL